ncbi:MAG: hypothetical protein RL217_1429 [Pseudomonadota bacterium]|jgi:glucose-6-phosphate 1-epimerase
MPNNILTRSAFIGRTVRGELELLCIRHPYFYAELLLQGAQLLHFAPTGEKNWLWLSDSARYQQGQSVRGGIPICWPWFGQALKNPDVVKNQIENPDTAPAHGFARSTLWQIDSLYESCKEVRIKLVLPHSIQSQDFASGALSLSVELWFSQDGLSLHLTTHNHSEQTWHISQALHSYFPTEHIEHTHIKGLENTRYIDTLTGWQEKTQQGAVAFTEETDRIYYSHAPLALVSPSRHLMLHSQGSNSAVVWNPWVQKSLNLSQFKPWDYQRMFCVETANALADAVRLAPKASHTLSLHIRSAVKRHSTLA